MRGMWVAIATDQHGAPRAWGAAPHRQDAVRECMRQREAYEKERPDLKLTITKVIHPEHKTEAQADGCGE